ncbi:MAG: energy transducer TonB [Sporomusaceae bacterium]|nr:energy transducer TonB [Sporomusaceae bacterium]
MTEYCGWRRAGLYSVLIHLGAAIFLGLLLGGNATQKLEADYVIDLDLRLEQGSGHAGGGGSGGDEPLLSQSAAVREAAPATVAPLPSQPRPAATPADLAEPVAPGIADSGDGGDSGDDAGGAVSSGSGGGSGGGTGSGSGSGSGSGRGYGEGAGYGEGSGYSGVMGRGSSPFDLAGFANAVEANKQYPYMAIKRHIQGSVTVRVALDPAGNLVGLSSVQASAAILEQAALQAVRAACPYPNASGAPISFTTTIRFVLNS